MTKINRRVRREVVRRYARAYGFPMRHAWRLYQSGGLRAIENARRKPWWRQSRTWVIVGMALVMGALATCAILMGWL